MPITDVSWLAYYMPLFGFLFVFTVMYAILAKTKVLGEQMGTNLIVSFVFAIIFISFAPGLDYVQTVTPWFVVLVTLLLFFMMIVGLAQGDVDKFMTSKISWAFLGLLAVIFLWSAIVVFNPFFQPYIDQFRFSDSASGAILLLIIAAAASWVITRKN